VRRGECIARVFETVREMVQLMRESWSVVSGARSGFALATLKSFQRARGTVTAKPG